MRIPFIWDTPRDKISFIILVVIPILLLLLALALSGCSAKVEDRKNVVCFKDEVATYRGIAKGPVFVVEKNDTHYFVFNDEQGEQIIFDLANQQCGIN